MSAYYSSSAEILYGEDEKAAIHQQLNRMLSNQHFSHSKRFPSFLRFIVQEELEGRGDQLKERTLGVEVFGRDADYDTNSDPIVRVTAAEIRKRIAQYYQDCGAPEQLRISLPPGSYMPHFEWPRSADVSSAHVPPSDGTSSSLMADGVVISPIGAQPPYLSIAPVESAVPRSYGGWFTAAGVAMAILMLAGWSWAHPRPSMLDSFWAPVLSGGDAVVVCYPQSHFSGINLRFAADPSQHKLMDEPANGIIEDDLQPLVSLSGLLDTRREHYILMGEDSATLTDLRRGPVILLGAFDNGWTLRLTRGLRYRFGNDPEMTHFWIEDTQSPTHVRWAIDRNIQETTNNYRDYAIVARFRDANTGKLAVVAAGIARGGTVAAGEFLTQPGDMDAIKSQAPRNWEGQNMEFVLSTEIIDGRSSPPKIEAAYFW
jgi:hypothetical protein